MIPPCFYCYAPGELWELELKFDFVAYAKFNFRLCLITSLTHMIVDYLSWIPVSGWIVPYLTDPSQLVRSVSDMSLYCLPAWLFLVFDVALCGSIVSCLTAASRLLESVCYLNLCSLPMRLRLNWGNLPYPMIFSIGEMFPLHPPIIAYEVILCELIINFLHNLIGYPTQITSTSY